MKTQAFAAGGGRLGGVSREGAAADQRRGTWNKSAQGRARRCARSHNSLSLGVDPHGVGHETHLRSRVRAVAVKQHARSGQWA